MLLKEPLQNALVWPQLSSLHRCGYGGAGNSHLADYIVGTVAHSRMLDLQIYLRDGLARRSAQCTWLFVAAVHP